MSTGALVSVLPAAQLPLLPHQLTLLPHQLPLVPHQLRSVAGKSRSATVVLAYMMTVSTLNLSECVALLRSVRSMVSPSPAFCLQLARFERTDRMVCHCSISLVCSL